MKSLARFFLLACALYARGAESIRMVPLDDRVVVEVPVTTNRVTTLSFPGPITAIDAAGVTADPKVPGLFQLAHTKGASFLSVRALEGNARANLNVRWNSRTYVFELVENPNPILALNLQALANPVIPPAPRLSPTRLLAILDKAKAFPLLRDQYPKTVADVEFRTYTARTNTTDLGDFEIRIEEIYRFNLQDTLVFRVVVINKGGTPLEYRPDSLGIRAGNRLYPQSITDATGLVPPQAESTIYFAVTGTPDGGRNELSLKNEFGVVVTRTSPPPAASVASPTPDTQLP